MENSLPTSNPEPIPFNPNNLDNTSKQVDKKNNYYLITALLVIIFYALGFYLGYMWHSTFNNKCYWNDVANSPIRLVPTSK